MGVVCLLAAAGCASAPQQGLFIRRHGRGPVPIEEEHTAAATPQPVTRAAVAAAVRAARAARSQSAPPALPTIETTDPALKQALESLAQHQTAAAHLAVAQAYQAVDVPDLALDHFDAALALDRRLAPAYDGRARIWRNWSLPGQALPNAVRAVFYAPRSAAARNTLGTVLLDMGDCDAAHDAFTRAAALDPAAGYARENAQWVARLIAAHDARCETR